MLGFSEQIHNCGIFFFKKIFRLFSAENDVTTSEFYEKPVAVGDFQKHCAQRRKYPVLLQIEYNNAVKERDPAPAAMAVGGNTTRHGARKANQEKNQNPRILPCKKKRE